MQKSEKALFKIPFLRKKMNRINNRRITLISTAAAKDRICFTSPGKGLMADKLIA